MSLPKTTKKKKPMPRPAHRRSLRAALDSVHKKYGEALERLAK